MLQKLLVAIFACRWAAAQQFALEAVQHRPSYDVDPVLLNRTGRPPIDLRQKRMTSSGYDPLYDTTTNFSKHTYIGCFRADQSITKATSDGSNYDPNECLAICKQFYLNEAARDIIVAVSGEKCGCVLQDMTEFTETDAVFCTFYCKTYQNPLCGGDDWHWGVFREYDLQALTSHGAFDPWRNIWFTVVVIKESTIRGGFTIPSTTVPERYYLHAVDTFSGSALFEYQVMLAGQVYGLQYDIDSTRLVGLYTTATTGRTRKDVDWIYQLMTIVINGSFATRPRMDLSLAPVQMVAPESSEYLAISGASAILSIAGMDAYVFTQSESAPMKRLMKDRVYLVRIPDAFIIYSGAVDFKIVQLFANERYGDVSAIGPRTVLGSGSSAQTYVYLCRVYRSLVDDRTLVDWQYNMINPTILTETLAVTADFRLYPGVAATEHLQNESAIMHRWTPQDNPDKAAPLILEVNIRDKSARDWCNYTAPDGCLGTMNYEIPYAAIYNREPGIPLSLKAPVATVARFTMEAGTIIVDFDKPTLKGALQVDNDGDFIPDFVDYTTQPTGIFDCAEVFRDDSILLLGPYDPEDGTSCIWMRENRIQINLPSAAINISVGQSIFVKPGVIFAKPENGQYSPAASNGVQVDLPDPTLDPVVVLTGSLQIDECSPVMLDASSSFNTGSLPLLRWSLVPPDADNPNPADMTNDPFRVFDPDLLALVEEALANSTSENKEVLSMESNMLEPAAVYSIQLSLTSRWQRTTNKTVRLTKLSFAAPMVSIIGPDEVESLRPNRVSLEADGRPSACQDANTNLGYRWSVTSGNLDFTSFPDIITNTKTLVIPSYTLSPPTDVDKQIEIYNFTVACFVNSPAGDVPERTAYAKVAVLVARSEVLVYFRTESRMLTKGDVLVLDVRGSQDPDDPTVEGQTFKGTFIWNCLDPSRVPCFPPLPGSPNNGDIEQIEICRQDIGQRIQDGGVTFFAPLFDDLPYCRYARGVLMLQTSNFTQGEYKFTVTAMSYDGRTDQKSVFIEITEVRVPRIILSIVDGPKAKYPVTVQIRIQGTVEGPDIDEGGFTRTFSWTVLVQQIASTGGNEQVNDPNNPLLEDQFVFVDQTDLYDTQDPARFQSSADSPNLLIRPGVLKP